MRRRLAVLAVAAVALAGFVAASAFAGIGAQPDGEVKRKGKPFKGLGVINTSGDAQSAGAKLAQGEKTTFTFRYTNVGAVADDFEVGGCGVPPGFRVRYRAGGEGVTQAVNEGSLVFPDVDPGERTPNLKAEVKVRASAPNGLVDEACVPGVAVSIPNFRDEPEWKVRVK